MLSFFKRTSLYILAIPVLFTFLGAASNQLVLVANHDSFPVMLNERKLSSMADQKNGNDNVFSPMPASVEQKDDTVYLDDVHCLMTSHTHLNALADIFDLKDGIYSIGDFLLMLGEWVGVFAPFVYVFDVTKKLSLK
jgi:hypothetical protein